MPPSPTLGERIRYHRERLSLSQHDLAAQLDVSQATVARWETAVHSPSLERMRDLAYAFGITLADLADGE